MFIEGDPNSVIEAEVGCIKGVTDSGHVLEGGLLIFQIDGAIVRMMGTYNTMVMNGYRDLTQRSFGGEVMIAPYLNRYSYLYEAPERM